MMRSSKTWLIVTVAVASCLSLWSTTQTWVTLNLVSGTAVIDSLAVNGQQIIPSLSPIAIAGLAAALALTISGKVFRFILGALVTVFGIAISSSPTGVLTDPLIAAAGSVAEVTGITGNAQADLVESATSTGFIWVTVVSGVMLAISGIMILILGLKWKAGGRKYAADSRIRQFSSTDEPDRIGEWESQNDGFDPSDHNQK